MEYSYIGKITTTHGLEGKVVLQHILEGRQPFKNIEHVFVEERRESYIPYFIENSNNTTDGEALVVFDEINTVEQAKHLVGKKVFVEPEVFAGMKGNTISTGMTGFTMIDKRRGALGIVEDMFETPGQVLATININQKEVIIPLVTATVLSVDASKKEIKVDLPDGLLEVYLD